MACDPADLKPGDCLLYGPTGLVGWLISLKTWHRIAHVEVYDGLMFGEHRAVGSRNGIGVNRYTLRTTALIRVLRPNRPFNRDLAHDWFETVARGQKYDFRAILRFLWPSEKPDLDLDRQICSAFAVRYYRAGGFNVCSSREDADKFAPFQFDVSPDLDEVWRA